MARVERRSATRGRRGGEAARGRGRLRRRATRREEEVGGGAGDASRRRARSGTPLEQWFERAGGHARRPRSSEARKQTRGKLVGDRAARASRTRATFGAELDAAREQIGTLDRGRARRRARDVDVHEAALDALRPRASLRLGVLAHAASSARARCSALIVDRPSSWRATRVVDAPPPVAGGLGTARALTRGRRALRTASRRPSASRAVDVVDDALLEQLGDGHLERLHPVGVRALLHQRP